MKYPAPRSLSHGFGVLTLSTLLAAPPAMAEDSPSTEQQQTLALDAVVVTGEKVERDLKSTASSVTVKSAREIDKLKSGDSTVHEVLDDVPNVLYTDSVGAPIIRGQDSQGPNNGANVFWGGTVPRATINLDGHYQNYNEMYFGAASAWDVDSIEVYRGPQTTSQGANAIAGAIIVKTKDPSFTPEGAYQAEIGSYNTRRSALAVSGPLTQELAGRLAVDYSARDTYIDYTNPSFKSHGTDQDFRSLNLRGKLLWMPEAIEGFSAKYTFAHGDSNRPTQENAAAPYHKLDSSTTTLPSWHQQTNTHIVDLDYDLQNGIKLFNQTQYSLSNVHRVVGVANSGDADIRQKNFSNESRINIGETQDTLSGMAGLYLARTDSDEMLYYSGISDFDDTKRNLGLFGETSYRLTDRWTLTTGLRYQQDHIQRSGTSPFATSGLDYDKTFSAFLPKVSLAFALTPQWTLGGMISRGYNPGGVSLNLSSKRFEEFDDERMWNYELFARASLLDDRLHLNGNLFYMDMKDAQYNIPVVISSGVTQSYTINAEKAHAYGLELSADYRVLDSLTLKASAGTLRTRIDSIDANSSYAHNEFARSPGYSISFGPSWDITDRLNLNAQVRHIDGYYSDVANTKAYAIDSYTVTDSRLSYRFNNQEELYIYAKNLFYYRSLSFMQVNRAICGTIASMTHSRTLDVGVKFSF
ncbi:MAG: Pesticin receptor [Pseudomonas citronellolis]|nr:MAG: Pesticin receptor [Pseudomonas citronellolis]